MIFQPGKRPGIIVFALGVVALEDGGCGALEGFGGFGGEGSVSRVVGNDGHKWSNGWEALSLSPGQRYAGIWVLYFQDRGALMRLTAPQMPTIGSTEDQITTQTKFPKNLTSAHSISRIMINTCHVARVYSCEADNSNDTNEANTIIEVSRRSGEDCEEIHLQPSQ